MKKKNRLLRIVFIMAFLVSLGLGNELWAAITSTGSGNWNAGGTWVGGVVPGASDDVNIATGHTVTIPSGYDAVAQSVTTAGTGGIGVAAGNGTLTTGALTTVGTGTITFANTTATSPITVTGATTIGSGTTLIVPSGTATFGGLVNNSGTLTLTGAAATMGAGFTNTLGTTTAGTSLAITGNVTVTAGTFATATSNLTVSGTTSIAASASITTGATGYKIFTGNVTFADGTSVFNASAGAPVEMTTPSTVLTLLTTNASFNLTLTGAASFALPAVANVFNNLTINTTAIGNVVTAGPGVTTTIDTLNIVTGTFTKVVGQALTINEMVTLAGSASAGLDLTGAGLVTIKQNASLSATGVLTTTVATPLALGVGGTAVDDFTLPVDIVNLASLVIDRAAGSDITLGGPLTTAGVLTLTSGNLIVGAYTLTTGGAFTNAAGTINLSGSSVVFNGAIAPVFTGAVTTNTATNITVNTTEAASHTILPASITTLNSLTIATGATTILVDVPASLTTTAGITVTSGTLDLNASNSTLVVGGQLTVAAAATAGIDMTDATLTLNGIISVGAGSTLTNTNTTTLNIGGAGAINDFSTILGTDLLGLTMNRAGQILILNPAGTIATGDLTITAGTVRAGTTSLAVTGDVSIAAAGTLDLATGTCIATLSGNLSGAGAISADGATLILDGTSTYAFTGSMTTNTSTDLTIASVQATDIVLPIGVDELNLLTINRGALKNVVLTGDLLIDAPTTATELASGVLKLNGNMLTFTGQGDMAAGLSIDATGSSSIVYTTLSAAIADWDANTNIVSDATTNLTFTGVAGGAYAIGNFNQALLKDLTMTVTGANVTVTQTANLELYGNLTMTGANSIFNKSTLDLTVRGNVSNTGGAGSLLLNGAGGTVSLYGAISPSTAAAATVGANTKLQVLENGTQFTLPAWGTIGQIVLNRSTGMKLSGNVTALGGTQTYDLDIVNGNLDLYGFDITFADNTVRMQEAAGRTVVNTNTAGKAIISAVSTAAETILNGIGLTEITASAGNFTVKRYPQGATLSGVGSSIKRIYEVTTSSATPGTAFKFAYDNSELNSNSAATLIGKQASDGLTMATITATFDGTASTTVVNTAGAVKISLSPMQAAVTRYYSFASAAVTTSAGSNTFLNTTGNGLWSTAGNWSLGAVPTTVDAVIIPTGNALVINANIEAASIEILGTSSMTLNPSVQLEVKGNLTLNSTATTALSMGSGAYLTVLGNLDLAGSGNILFNDGTPTIGENQYVTINGIITKTGTGSFSTTSSTNYGTYLTLGGTADVTIPADFATLHTLTVNKTGGTVYQSANITITGTSTLNVAAGIYTVGNFNLTVSGNTTIAAGATLNADYTLPTVTRTFGGTVTVSGNGILNASGPRISAESNTTTYNNIFSGLVSLASGTLNISNSKTKIAAGIAAGTWTLNATGASLTSSAAAIDFTGSTFQTDQHTDLTLNVAPVAFPSVAKLNNFTSAVNVTLAGNLELTGSLRLSANTLAIAGYSLTVNGTINNAGGILDASVANSALLANGPVSSWGTLNNTTNLDLTIGGSGALASLPAAVATISDVVMNRANTTLTLTPAGVATVNSLTITSGTVAVPADQNFVVTTTTNIGENGVLNAGSTTAASSRIFTTGLSGSGILIVTGTGANYATLSIPSGCTYAYTGTITTNASTNLDIQAIQAGDVSLPSSIANLNNFLMDRGTLAPTVTLNGNLTIADPIAATDFARGTLLVNGNTVTFSGTYTSAGAGSFILDAGASSSLVFTGAPNFVPGAITTDETTNITINANPITDPDFTKLNNLTVTGGTTTLGANIELFGNLAVTAGTFAKSTYTLTINGDVTVASGATMTLDAASGLVILKGQLNSAGTVTTDNSTLLKIDGTTTQFNLPAGVGTLGTLTLNRPSGMRINNNLAVGIAATNSLVLSNGDLDLNGFNVTMANATAYISEAAGATVINTGATTVSGTVKGALITATVTATEAAASGIGVVEIAPAANYIVRRFPMIIPITGVGLSSNRVYQISTNVPTSVTLQYDNTELASTAAGLRLYTSATSAFTTFVDQTLTDGSNRAVNQNTPSGKGNVAYTSFSAASGADYLYAMAAAPGAGGVLYSSVRAGDWDNASTWSPSGIPSSSDQVYIGPYTVTLKGNGADYYCQSLMMNQNSAKLVAYNNATTGDNVTLNVMGNISVTNGASVDAINGTGRLNITIGDGTAGVSSTITANNSYVIDNGLSVNNLTLNSSTGTTSNTFRVYGNLNLLGSASLTSTGIVEFFGGSNATQTIAVANSAALTIEDLYVTNSANVTTASNMTIEGMIQVNPFSQLIATNGITEFPVTSNQTGWAVQENATLRLYNVAIAGTADFAPKGNIEIAGDFTKSSTSAFLSTFDNTVTFRNTNQKELVHSGATQADLTFYNLAVAPNSSVKTSSSFLIAGNVSVALNATFAADNGTIEISDAAIPSRISNVSDHTLVFYNLTVNDAVLTSDSWKVAGDLAIATSLTADNGTVTFENVSEKTITNSGANQTSLTFYGLKVADGSKVKTAAAAATGSFTIKNNATNPTGAGLFVEGTGSLVVTTVGSTTYFDAGAGIAAGYPKSISKSSAGTLKFGLLNINATTNNEVTTATDFEIQGIGTSAFNNAGAGAKFTATAGTVKFTGATPYIASVSPAVSTFYNLLTEGTTNLKITDAQEIFVNGNITVDGSSQINPDAAGTAGRFILSGTTDQTIGGTSTVANAVEFGKLVINKANGGQVLMNTDVEISSDLAAQLVLTNGILNLGSKTLTVGAGVISRLNGAINGATGTYLINTAHKTPYLDDSYFTVNNVPTLYNLKVSAAHATANDLTVNGTLNLNTGALTIASGTSLAAAKQLILNGNLTRTAGTITCASAATSKLVFQGTGTVSGGLQDNFFSGTYPSLVMARQEALGGNLTIDAAGNLTINTGTKFFDLGARTLTFTNGATVTRVSGSITAGLLSTIAYGNIARVPSNLFTNNQVGNFVATADPLYLDGDLAMMTSLNYPNTADIYTGENTLTFGPSLTFTNPMTSANHVKGNLVRTVNANTLVEFPVGTLTQTGATGEYTPVSLRLATSGNTQQIKVSTIETDPTIGRGGNPTNAVNFIYKISTIGNTINDSVLVKFQYPNSTAYESVSPVSNGAFAAKWNGLSWTDYRNRLAIFTATSPRLVTMSGYPVALSDLSGDWAIFTVDANTDVAKDRAIAINANRVVITKIDPSPVKKGQSFKATVQLQDMNGQPITATSPFAVRLQKEYGTSLETNIDAVIPVGTSMTTVAGLVMSTASTNNQLKADTAGGSANWQPSLSEPFAVIDASPAVQASNITFSNVKETSMTVTWTDIANTGNVIILAKAESLFEDAEFPVNANTYVANRNFGSGSSIGNATVLYKAAGTGAGLTPSINVTGLSPNTNYYFYVLAYSGSEGYENYKLTAATKNPNAQKTTGSSDDDVSLGTNNTLATSKAIGTNTPVTGTIGTSSDEDWFNFSVTNATPNVRVQMYGLANNYNLEVYDMSGRRIRRGIRTATGSEGPVVNDLPAGTYTVRIYSADGSYSATNTYTLKVGTKSSEIFSVTP